MKEIIEKAKKIKCLISDVDGVLTNGLLYIDNHGNELKAFHVQDGMGLKLLMAAGVKVAIITTARNEVIDHRMKQLGVSLFYKGQVEKQTAFEDIKNTLDVRSDECAYVGDDLPDLPIIRQVGLGIAVGNAVTQVREFADWQTQAHGGQGAIREVCDFILNAQNKSETALQEYFKL